MRISTHASATELVVDVVEAAAEGEAPPEVAKSGSQDLEQHPRRDRVGRYPGGIAAVYWAGGAVLITAGSLGLVAGHAVEPIGR